MKATELRIGNWVNIITPDKSIDIQVTMEYFYNTYSGDHPNEFDCFPIPLTEEWLKRFGFIDNIKVGRFDSPMWRILNRDKGKEVSMNVWQSSESGIWGITLREELVFDDVTPTAINYVHQLQNLYFALTGQELNQNKEDE